MSAPLRREPGVRAQAKVLSFPTPIAPPQPVIATVAALPMEMEDREPRHSALLLAAVAVIALLLYFSAALV